MQCDGSRCLSQAWVCDGEKDCLDGSDEKPDVCAGQPQTCLPGQFQCNITKRCLPKSWVCDSQVDCGQSDHSDEEDCGEHS